MIDTLIRRHTCRVFSIICLFCASAAYSADRPPPRVLVAEVQKKIISPVVKVPGTVASRHILTAAAEQEGRLINIIDEGDRVLEGHTLYEIDGRDLEAEKQVIKADIVAGQAGLAFLERESNRLKRLAKTNLATQTQLDRSLSDHAVAAAGISAKRARLRQIKQQLNGIRPVAPFSGTVVERFRQRDDWVKKGDTLLKIIDDNHLEVVAFIPIRNSRFLKSGLWLGIERTAYDGYTSSGRARIKYVSPASKAELHRVKIRLDLPQGDWQTGEIVRVSVPDSKPEPALVVPRDALVLRPGGVAVFRVGKDGKAERVGISTGAAQGDLISVIGNLHEGDQVIIRGAERLRPGQQVTLQTGQRP